MKTLIWLCAVVLGGVAMTGTASAVEKLKALIIDGENPYHDWQVTTPVLKKILEDSGRFTVEVATVPAEGQDASGFHPVFADYDVVVSNYNSQRLPPADMQQSFLDYLKGGGGFVVVHAADNSFAHWPEYNDVIGLGGWYERDEKWGPYVYYKGGKLVRDDAPGRCGSHGPQHEFVVTVRDKGHPITRDLPERWLHAKDELYDSLRGPAKNMQVLATAYSDPKHNGTDRDEPMLLVLDYGKGRVFHTIMGHADYSMNCVGFATTLQRGAEWAATGEVTIDVPKDFPTEAKVSSRK